jgi:sulfopropanediol 3-dehydrogenase
MVAVRAWPANCSASQIVSTGAAWRAHGSVAVAEDRDQAIALSDEIAPEHLEVQVREDELDYYLQHLCNYGSLFLGDEATVAYGDKAVGTNHVLPTMRASTAGLSFWSAAKKRLWPLVRP